MILKALKVYFKNELIEYYNESEIDSFFNLFTEHILKMKRIDVSLNLYQVISGKKFEKYRLGVERLKNYEPVQYIIGDTEFYGLKFNVNKSVLIPRPETEELVDWIFKENQSKGSISILDIGTGSGCIAIALAKNLPNAKVFALDVSKDALMVAKSNAILHNVDITFLEENILNSSIDNLSFDIVVSNPPYVRELEKALMADNVLKHEPHLALFVEDDDALLFYRKITELSKNLLIDTGQLYFEINEYLGEETKILLEKERFKNIELKQDFFEKDRMIKGVKI